MDETAPQAIVIYGTTSGNAELVAECIAAGLEDQGLSIKLTRVEKTNVATASQAKLLVLVSSTWNVGKLNDYFIPFYEEMLQAHLPEKAMAVVALGDSKNYDIFCGAADFLEEAVQKSGGSQILPTLKIDGPPHAKLDEYRHWGRDLADAYKSYSPTPII